MGDVPLLTRVLPEHLRGMQFCNPDHPIDTIPAALYPLRRPTYQRSVRRLVREIPRCHYVEISWTGGAYSMEVVDTQRWWVYTDVSWELCNAGYVIPAVLGQDHRQTMKLSPSGEVALERGLCAIQKDAYRELASPKGVFSFEGYGLVHAHQAVNSLSLTNSIGKLYAYFKKRGTEDPLERYAVLPDEHLTFKFRLGGN